MLLLLADYALLCLHLLVIGVNVLGWMWARTARLQRWVLALTLLSWLGGGFFYGWGYCFLTDWQWRVKEARGFTDLPVSFLSYLTAPFTGAYAPRGVADVVAVAGLAVGLFGALWRGLRDQRGSRWSFPSRL